VLGRLTIYQRIVAVTAVTVLLSFGAMLLVTFRGPPPMAKPLSASDLKQVIERRDVADWAVTRASLPVRGQAFTGYPLPALARDLAGLVDVPPGNVRLFIDSSGIPGPVMELRDPFVLGIRSGDRWQIYRGTPHPPVLRWYAVSMGLMALLFALLMIPAWCLARSIGTPIARLAAAADRDEAGADGTNSVDTRHAPSEVRHLTAAIARMQARIFAHDRDRTALLAAIAHDLRTPMTRLSFRVDKLDEPDRERAQGDIAEMRAMITSFLAFMDARRTAPLIGPVDMASLVETLIDGYAEQGAAVSLQGSERLAVLADAGLLRRCIQNVVDNALRYAGSAKAALHAESKEAVLLVEDEGPGIPDALIAHATEPFWRGEGSRARETGGAGLGLAIVAEGMAAMGGRLAIANRPGGGLRVSLHLPLRG
jgi:two-component system OmpR family sensor kinase